MPPVDGGHDENAPTEARTDPIEDLIQGIDPQTVDEEAIEDLVDQHPLAHELAQRLKDARALNLSRKQEEEYVENIRSVRSEIGHQIKSRLGLTEEDPQEVARRKELERLKLLGSIISTLTHEETEDELLAKYHLVDEDGRMTKESMKSPLFRGDTGAAFNRYMKYAIQFDAMEEAEKKLGIPLKNAPAASNMRGTAHNAVAELVARDLGLPFDSSRRFVAKARDAIVPGLQEKTNYATLLQGEKLAARFGNDMAAFTRTSLKGLIDEPMEHENNPSKD